MTDLSKYSGHHTSELAAKNAKRRNAAQTRLKLYGITAIALSGLALVALLWTVLGNATGAIREHYVTLPVTLDQSIDAEGTKDPKVIGKTDFAKLTKNALKEQFPMVKNRKAKKQLYDVVSGGAAFELRTLVQENPELIGTTIDYRFLASDISDLYLKGEYGTLIEQKHSKALDVTATGKDAVKLNVSPDVFTSVVDQIQTELRKRASRLDAKAGQENNGVRVFMERMNAATDEAAKADAQAQVDARTIKRDGFIKEAEELRRIAEQPNYEGKLDKFMPSVLVRIGTGWVKLTEIAAAGSTAKVILPIGDTTSFAADDWALYVNSSAEVSRKTTDNQVVWLESLRADDRISSNFNWRFFSSGDSREPELAGIWGALVGSMLTMFVTFFLAFPIGVLSAIYLEEFAPKNKLTDFVEVNINNLAAVPSIVFGLLGLAVFLNVFGVPRSAPLAGGIVLALMSLPTIIIASRAAIRAVPPSIRDAALGLGASKLQTSFHHVLPLAMPGVLTGSIIAMAQALGETAPLIMIGMVAFIVDIPTGITDSASVLPVQVFRWADFPERAFEAKTAAAICVLLVFLVVMNLIAIVLRKRFERRW